MRSSTTTGSGSRFLRGLQSSERERLDARAPAKKPKWIHFKVDRHKYSVARNSDSTAECFFNSRACCRACAEHVSKNNSI